MAVTLAISQVMIVDQPTFVKLNIFGGNATWSFENPPTYTTATIVDVKMPIRIKAISSTLIHKTPRIPPNATTQTPTTPTINMAVTRGIPRIGANVDAAPT